MLFPMCLTIVLFVVLMMVHKLHHIQKKYLINYNHLPQSLLLNILVNLVFENINQFLYLLYKYMDKMDADLLKIYNLNEVYIYFQKFFLILCQ